MKILNEKQIKKKIKELRSKGRDLINQRNECSFFEFGKTDELDERISRTNEEIRCRRMILDILYDIET